MATPTAPSAHAAPSEGRDTDRAGEKSHKPDHGNAADTQRDTHDKVGAVVGSTGEHTPAGPETYTDYECPDWLKFRWHTLSSRDVPVGSIVRDTFLSMVAVLSPPIGVPAIVARELLFGEKPPIPEGEGLIRRGLKAPFRFGRRVLGAVGGTLKNAARGVGRLAEIPLNIVLNAAKIPGKILHYLFDRFITDIPNDVHRYLIKGKMDEKTGLPSMPIIGSIKLVKGATRLGVGHLKNTFGGGGLKKFIGANLANAFAIWIFSHGFGAFAENIVVPIFDGLKLIPQALSWLGENFFGPIFKWFGGKLSGVPVP